MQSNILKMIAEDINITYKEEGDEKIIFGNKTHVPFLIDKKNFSTITEGEDRRIAFIDGGQCEIIGGSDFSVQLIRTYCCVFFDGKKIDEKKNEFFILVNAAAEGEDIIYKTRTYTLKGKAPEDISINSMDGKITEGGKRAKISKTGEIIRKICEIKTAEKMIEMDKADIIMFDGTLECDLGEEDEMEKMYEAALLKNKIVCAIAKTTNMFTDKGRNALACINRLSKEAGLGVWQYNNIAEIEDESHKAEICIVKLNAKSRHCFRFEIFKKQKEEKDKALSSLVNNCRDISFPGYPYGMITADKFARVSNKEKEYLKQLILAKAGNKTDQLMLEMANNDAHELLDSIN